MRRMLLPAIGLLALATPLTALSLFIWLFVLAGVMPGSTRARRGVFALITAVGINAAALTALAVLGVGCSPRSLMAVLLAISLLVVAARPGEAAASWISREGAISLAFGGMTYAILALPLARASAGKAAAVMSFSTDGGTHLELVSAIRRHHGYVQLLHPSGLSDAVDRYPSGWHGSVWIASELWLGDSPSRTQLLTAVALLATGTYALFAALCCRVALSLAGTPSKETGARVPVQPLIALTTALVVGPGIFLPQMASYTQVAALGAVLCLILLGTGTTGTTPQKMVVLGASCIVLMQCWYLMALVIAVPATMLMLRWRPRPGALALLAAGVAPICLFPIVTGPGSARLAATGPTYLPTLLGIVGLLVATAVSCRYLATSRAEGSGLLLAATVAGLLTLVALVVKQGFISASGVSYYAAKVLLATLILGVVGTGACLSTATKHRTSSIAAGLALAGIAAASWSTRHDAIPPRLNPSTNGVSARTLDAIFRDHPNGRSPETMTWVLDGCNRVWDRIATKWLYDTSLSWTQSFTDDLYRLSMAKAGDVSMFAGELADPSISRIEVYVHRPCDTKALAELSTNPKVRVIRVA